MDLVASMVNCIHFHGFNHHFYEFLSKIEAKQGFPGGSDGKKSASNVEDLDSVPGLGRCPGGGHEEVWISKKSDDM